MTEELIKCIVCWIKLRNEIAINGDTDFSESIRDEMDPLFLNLSREEKDRIISVFIKFIKLKKKRK